MTPARKPRLREAVPWKLLPMPRRIRWAEWISDALHAAKWPCPPIREDMVKMLLKPETWVLLGYMPGDGPPGGAVFFTGVTKGHMATIHGAVWNKKFLGRDLTGMIGRAAVKAAFERWDLFKIEAAIPQGNALARRFVEALGMKLEGTRERGFLLDGELCPLSLYGILRSEIS